MNVSGPFRRQRLPAYPGFLTICIFRRLRIVYFRPKVRLVGKNERGNTYLAHIQRDSEILTNQPARKGVGNALCEHPVCRISVFVAMEINAVRDGH